MVDLSRWRSTWRGLGVEPPADAVHVDLLARYAEPHRRYHTVQHLDECFARLDETAALAEHLHEIELALWFHDAVYDTHRFDNEAQSAAQARQAATAAGLSVDTVARVEALILATRHDAAAATPDATLLVDVDLAILGAPDARFDEYERQVREEYAWVPEDVFRRERRKILERFLQRPRLYGTALFHERFDAAARVNLARSIAQLAT
jgi:predicted metal-dependent HD superfamily phosphohydrolase